MPALRFTLIVLLAALGTLPVSAVRPSMVAMPIEVDGFPLAISPDGTRLAGVDADGARFCVWDLATGKAACDGDIPAPVEARSVTWAPDSSAVAFSLGSSSRLVDSDIYVFDVASGTLRNVNGLTPTLQWAGEGSLLLLLPTGGAIIPLTPGESTPAG